MSQDLEAKLLELYGPLIGGSDLWKALGFKSQAALARAIRLKTVGVDTWEIPGRKGRFANTLDVARWIAAQQQNPRPQPNRGRYPTEEGEPDESVDKGVK
ncbi:MAG: hypothetical protein OSA97_17795 [Nevskia sp.]|nr:hypothetical protein [Nevskia sp.]